MNQITGRYSGGENMTDEIKSEAVRQHRQDQYHITLPDQILEDTQPFVDHSTAAQAYRLLAALRNGPVSTINAAKDLDIVHPPSTVRYLRRQGCDILTEWTYLATEPGRKAHRVGLYVLNREAA